MTTQTQQQGSNGLFKGKIMSYTNFNGQERKIEKEFTSQKEMDTFLNRNTIRNNRNESSHLGRFGQLFNDETKHISGKYGNHYSPSEGIDQDLQNMLREKAKIESEENQKRKEKESLEKNLEERKKLKTFFAGKKGQEENIKRINEGIKKCEEKIKSHS